VSPHRLRPSVHLAALAAAAFLAYAVGARLDPRARALDPDPSPEEARALDRVLPRATARIAPSLLKVHPAAAGADEGRKTRSAVALAPDLAVMDAVSVAATGVEDLVLEDLSGHVHKARVRGRDLRLRIVLLEAPDRGLVPAARSGRVPEPGEHVLALGTVYAAAGRPSVAFGIVSAASRFDGRAIQVDCGIDPANAGGALVDLEGALVGVPVLVDRKLGDDSGVGFAVPCARIETALPRLRAGDELEPAFLGIALPKGDPALAPSLEGGVRVEGVLPGAAAKAAGIETNDVIIKVDGLRIRGVRAFVTALSDKAAGDEVSIVVLRAGVELTLEATLGARK
jgi:S1-C subfamily serine protease